jgi:hypothetical protein
MNAFRDSIDPSSKSKGKISVAPFCPSNFLFCILLLMQLAATMASSEPNEFKDTIVELCKYFK